VLPNRYTRITKLPSVIGRIAVVGHAWSHTSNMTRPPPTMAARDYPNVQSFSCSGPLHPSDAQMAQHPTSDSELPLNRQLTIRFNQLVDLFDRFPLASAICYTDGFVIRVV
jgi:hypothetical protein